MRWTPSKTVGLMLVWMAMVSSAHAAGPSREITEQVRTHYNFKFHTLDGEGRVLSSDFEACRILVMVAWASDSEASMQAVPKAREIAAELTDRGVGFLWFCVDQDRQAGLDTAAALGLPAKQAYNDGEGWAGYAKTLFADQDEPAAFSLVYRARRDGYTEDLLLVQRSGHLSQLKRELKKALREVRPPEGAVKDHNPLDPAYHLREPDAS